MNIQIENLKAQMTGKELNIYQKADALIEFNKLLNYVDKIEKLLKLCEVSQQRELFFCDYCKEDNPHKIYEFKKMKECKGCGLITKI